AESNALLAERVAKTLEIPFHLDAVMIDAPLLSGLFFGRLGRTLSAHDHDEAAEGYVDLGRASGLQASHDFAAELTDIPIRGGLRIFGHERNMIEGEADIWHDCLP